MSVRQFEHAQTRPQGQFEIFDLTIQLGPGTRPWLSASSRVGSLHGIPRHTKVLPELHDLLDQIYDYTDAIQFAEPQPKLELSNILTSLVFGDAQVLQLFQATRGVAADRGRQLLVRILASPHLAALPWELLYDPAAIESGRDFPYLALSPDVHIVRLARGRTYSVDRPILTAPLNLLVVISSPNPRNSREDWLAFDTFEVKRGLMEELAPLVKSGALRIDVEDRPTLENLRRRIGAQERGYHLFHYIGHALPGHFILEDKSGQRDDVPGTTLMEMLRLCPDLRLAVFAGCETARPSADPTTLDVGAAIGWRDLLSLADQCVQGACPNVVGMQAVLPFSTERIFSRFFYQALANGYPVAEALRLARSAIQGDKRYSGDLLDWSVPALFVGSNEPDALLPRSATMTALSTPPRAELKLGLRESNVRFFARELPLRQLVDMLSGRERERIAVVTGVTRVGKTSLVARALEELGNTVSHVLYIHFDRLLPIAATINRVITSGEALTEGNLGDLGPTEKDKIAVIETALKNLCEWTNELLNRGDGNTRVPDTTWTIRAWWDHLIDEVAQKQFVLAIDDFGLLDHLCHDLRVALLTHLTARWHHLKDAHLSVTEREQIREICGAAKLQPLLISNLLKVLPKALQEKLQKIPAPLLSESGRELSEVLESLLIYEGIDKRLRTNNCLSTLMANEEAGIETICWVIDNLTAIRNALGEAICALIDRRSRARVVITSIDVPRFLQNTPNDQKLNIRLATITWAETWQWIRRNLPVLVCLGEESLLQLWPRFGAELDRWEELERHLIRQQEERQDKRIDLQKLINEVAPIVHKPARTESTAMLTRRGQRPLRIAVAGPHLAHPSKVAEALFTHLAIEYGIGSRSASSIDALGAIGVLIQEPSPFGKGLATSMTHLIAWLKRVMSKQPDIILLDYGSPFLLSKIDQLDEQSERLHFVHHSLLITARCNSLLIAAGGNSGLSNHNSATLPGVYPEVLSIGALDNDGNMREYTEWHPKRKKPDLFMADDLSTSPLQKALKPGLTRGTSLAALNALATATLVWAILPDLSPQGVRQLMNDASKPIFSKKPALSLEMDAAVDLARQHAVEYALKNGPVSRQTLGAMTGLEPGVLTNTLEVLMNASNRKVIQRSSGRLVQFELLSNE